jgi:Transcription factor WhiB
MTVSKYARRPTVGPVGAELPRMPDLSGGSCSRHPHPDWWSSHDQHEREAAMHVCEGCVMREPCASWAVMALPVTDQNVWGAMSGSQRVRLKRGQAAAAQGQPWGLAAINSAKTHCDKGHPLAGANLMTLTRPDGRTKRMCRTCHRAQVARSARLARQVQPAAISEARRARYQRDRDRILARQRAAYARRKARQATPAAA